ncbi:HlyD family secretion protein [Arcticibacter sp. MXS-1]|uniref:HlyD family secretion protein n=1 Tax=Arcticibacter sp. MXS-1 TaxID=3341726 RepID=UPI0035A8D58C
MAEKKNKYTHTDVMITKITGQIAVLVLIALVVWGCLSLRQMWTYEETNDAQVEEYINPVTSRVGGFIKEIRYEENQDVKKGDTLIVIDNNEYLAQEQEAEAALMNAKAQIEILSSNIRTSQTGSKVSSAQVEAAKARLWKQEQEYKRYKRLYDAESVTGQQFENVKTALDVARAEYQSSIENYQASLSKVQDVQSQQSAALAEIRRREAVLSRNKLNVSYSVIAAPYDGKMGRRTIQTGQQIQPGQTLAYIVDRQEGKWVIANFKETQIRNMRIGQSADIETDAFPGVVYHGRVESLSPATGARFSLLPPDNSTGNFVKITQRIPVKIRLTDDRKTIEPLRAGMNAEVSLRKDEKEHE